tara:strand:+ start:4564 stop:9897 length:5334 start_codon:yes stop_codon:yes gene_type:complete
MGFFDRIEKIVDAAVDLSTARVNTVLDIVTAPFTDDEYEGFTDTVRGIANQHVSDEMVHTLGPGGSVEVAVGGLPEQLVRKPLRDSFEMLETGWREGVSEPLTTAFTVGSLAESQGSYGALLDPSTWREGYDVAQWRSPGQALTLAWMTDDILDQEEVISAEGKRYYNLVSGTLDAGARIFLAPEVVVGKAITVGRETAKRTAFNNYFDEGGGFDRFADDVGRVSDDAATVADDAATPPAGPWTQKLLDADAQRQADIDAGKSFDEMSYGEQLVDLDRFAEKIDVSDPSFGPLGEITINYNHPWYSAHGERVVEISWNPKEAFGVGLFEPSPLQQAPMGQRAAWARPVLRKVKQITDEMTAEGITVVADVAADRRSLIRLYETAGFVQVPRGAAPVSTAAQQTPLDLNMMAREGMVEMVRRPVPAGGVARETGETAVKGADDADALAGRLREKYFPTHHEGDLIALELAHAHLGTHGYAGGRQSVENVMRFFMGESSAINRIAEESPAVAHRFKRLWEQANNIQPSPPPGTVGANAKKFADAQDIPQEMIDDLLDAETGLPEVLRTFGSIDQAVRPTVARNLIDNMNHSGWYRSAWSMQPIRKIRDMRPQHFVWAGDANSGEQVARMLREAGYSPDEITRFRGEWARTSTVGRAETLAPRMQREAMRRVIRKNLPQPHPTIRKDPKKLAAFKQEQDELVEDLLEDFSNSNNAAREVLKQVRRYDPDANISTIAYVDDGIESVHQVPLTPSQLQQTVVMADIKNLQRFMDRHNSRWGDRAWNSRNFAGGIKDGAMSSWRSAVLLRPAWVLRVVGDEQFRLMAKLGTFNRLKSLLLEDRPRYIEAVLRRKMVEDGVLDTRLGWKFTGARAGVAAGLGLAVAGPVGLGTFAAFSVARNRANIHRLTQNLTVRREARDLAAAGYVEKGRDHLASIGEGPLDILGHQVDQAFGDALSPQTVWAKANSANRQSRYLMLRDERQIYDDLVEEFGDWKPFLVMDAVANRSARRRYGDAWERVVNDHYASSPVGRIAFDDTIGDASARADALVAWLDTPAGRKFAKDNPLRFRDDLVHPAGHPLAGQPIDDAAKAWADAVVQATDRMVIDGSLRQLLANGNRVYFDDVLKMAEKDGMTGQGWTAYVGDVHGQEVILTGGKDKQVTYLRGIVNKLFDRLGTVTTDNLSRNPYFKHVYETDMRRRIEAFYAGNGEYRISEQALRGLEQSARGKALQETRDLLYDLAERSELSDMLRTISPFFNAWGEVLSRWAGLALENPAWVARASMVFRADPSQVDVGSYFEIVQRGGEEVTLPDGSTEMRGGEKYFQFRLPQFAEGAVGSGLLGKAIDEQGTIRFRADSLNMVTQVVPGVGPIVQIAASRIVDYDPNLEDAFSFVLPYGPTRGGNFAYQGLEAFQPAWVKRVTAALTEDRAYESQAATIMLTRMAEMADGDRDQIDFSDGDQLAEFIGEVKRDATNFMFLRAIASAFSPASIGFHSPYQHYIDYYQDLRAKKPRTVDKEFAKYLLDEGQGGFFALSARFSKSNEGLPATIEAEMTRTKYLDMIRRYPEVGGLIIGIEGGGEARWSAAVYERQLREEISPGSGMTRRERLSLQDIAIGSRVREGWVEYRKVNDIIYNEMRSRGLPNLRVAEARDLVAVRKAAITKLGEKYPRWYDVYRNPDLTKWEDRIAGMRAIVKDERLAQRDDIRLIGEYLKMRDVLTGELARRSAAGGSGDITSGSNMDVRAVWQAWTDEQMNNPTFSDLLWRWLEFDPLSKVTWPKSQQEK